MTGQSAKREEGVPPATLQLPSGPSAPRIGLGTFQLEGRACRHAVAAGLAMGYRHVDTAEGYANEREVGRALREAEVPRDRVFLVSKVWRDHLRPPKLRRHLEGSLHRLGVDHLDLYLVHWPNSDIPPEDIAGAMERARQDGVLRSWGVSNYTETHLAETLPHGGVATNQVELHPYFRQSRLRAFCEERRVPLTAYSPLARGAVLDDPALRKIASGHGASSAQVALAWSLHRGHLVIPKASGEAHLEENLGALEISLSDEEMRTIEALPQRDRLFDFEWSEFDR